ncbi:Putative zinc metalloprotease PA3649 [Geodia barretti]|uniref:Zinc metalloprotease PA3649 n=1 Tax=Geodia barretti TaxID=519541 RepID=A0AA35U1C9_GEOBA|nr:Putative zinc metalloprotease PA3649 [Geodia barretti]
MDLLVDKLNYIWPFLAIITPVVFFHELGHYLVARINGVRVEVFAVGFGPELFGIDDRHGTRWKFCALPLGGYVKFAGDADVASMSAEGDGPLTARFILRQIAIFAVFFIVVGQRYTPVEIGAVRDGSPAAVAGLQPGDRLVELNGSRVERFEELQFTLLQSLGEPITLAVERGGAELEFTVKPEIVEVLDAFDRPQQLGDIGVRPFTPSSVAQVVAGSPAERGGLQAGDNIVRIGDSAIESFDHLRTIVERNAGVPLTFVVERGGREVPLTVTPNDVNGTGRIGVYPEEQTAFRDLGVGESIWAGVEHTYTLAAANLRAIGQMIVGARSTEQLSGPVGIAVMSRSVLERGVSGFVEFAALISIALGLINLFPIPPLDGGHLLYNGLEAAFRRPLTARIQQIGAMVGLTLVIALMVWVTTKDIIGLTS